MGRVPLDTRGMSRCITCAWQSIARGGTGARRWPSGQPTITGRRVPPSTVARTRTELRRGEETLFECLDLRERHDLVHSNDTSASGRSTGFPLSSDSLSRVRLHAAQHEAVRRRVDDSATQVLQLPRGQWRRRRAPADTEAMFTDTGCSSRAIVPICSPKAASANSRWRPLRHRGSSGAPPRRPCVASTSVRDLITKSGQLALRQRRGSSAPSRRRDDLLPFMCPQRFGQTWSSEQLRPATPRAERTV